jgi:hypothetical protein
MSRPIPVRNGSITGTGMIVSVFTDPMQMDLRTAHPEDRTFRSDRRPWADQRALGVLLPSARTGSTASLEAVPIPVDPILPGIREVDRDAKVLAIASPPT